MTLTIAEIDAIAEEAHAGQFRKFGGEPYITHPRRIAETFGAGDGAIEDGEADFHGIAVALLHDVLEDTDITAGDLLARGVPDYVVSSVMVLTRGDETYGQYLDRVVLSGDKVAIAVKTADLRDNLRDLPLGNSLRARYEAGLRRVGAVA